MIYTFLPRQRLVPTMTSLLIPALLSLRQRLASVRATAERETRRIENEWWINFASEVQGYVDENYTTKFYDSNKTYGPTFKRFISI